MVAVNAKNRKSAPVTIRFADSAQFPAASFCWGKNGLSLKTKWHFTQGAEVELGVEIDGQNHRCFGIIVACSGCENDPGVYDTVVFFPDPPPSLIREATCSCGFRPEAN